MADERDGAGAAIVAAYRGLSEAGLLPLSAGNLSVRAGERLLITPTGADRGLRVADLVLIDQEGRAEGAGIPSSEWSMHAAIYRARPDAGAVVHTHGDACSALACLRRPLPSFHYMVAGFGGDDVPCTGYAPFGSARLAGLAADALARRTACLLANHGMICHGATIEAAAKTALTLEMLCRQYLLALPGGEPVLLGPDEMAEARRRYGFYGRARIPEDQPAADA